MNVPMLLQIRDQILAAPDSFRMDTWSCGTAHCIAGWACVLAGDPVADQTRYPGDQRTRLGWLPHDRALRVMGLSAGRWDSCDLFHVSAWRPPWSEMYDLARLRAERAQIAAWAIEDYILTDGWTKEIA